MLCQTEKMAPGRAASGEKWVPPSPAASPEFCMPTSTEIARRVGTGARISAAAR